MKKFDVATGVSYTTELREVHGQLVEVKVYDKGPSIQGRVLTAQTMFSRMEGAPSLEEVSTLAESILDEQPEAELTAIFNNKTDIPF